VRGVRHQVEPVSAVEREEHDQKQAVEIFVNSSWLLVSPVSVHELNNRGYLFRHCEVERGLVFLALNVQCCAMVKKPGDRIN
jgi:hypothetical protein